MWSGVVGCENSHYTALKVFAGKLPLDHSITAVSCSRQVWSVISIIYMNTIHMCSWSINYLTDIDPITSVNFDKVIPLLLIIMGNVYKLFSNAVVAVINNEK